MQEMNKASLLSWLLNRHIHEYLDTAGRPIGEGRSEAYEQVETQFKKCPYPGSRHHHEQPMNFSALQSITPHWREIVPLLAWLGQRYRTYNQCEVTSYYDLARISGMGIFLADYLALRTVNPLSSGQVPVIFAGLYKVCLGFQQVTFLAMMNDIFSTGKAAELPDAKGFYAWLDENKLLIGEAEVCGGSELMISKAYEAMCGFDQAIPDVIEEALPELATLEIDWQAYDSFAANSSNLWRKAIHFIIQMRGFGLQANDPALPEDLKNKLNAWFNGRSRTLLDKQSGLTVDIARLTLSESEHTLEEWLLAGKVFLDEIAYQEPPQSTEITPTTAAQTRHIMQQLEQDIALTDHQELVSGLIAQQLARYDVYEAAVLRAFNHHLDQIQQSLGHATRAPDTPVAAPDLVTLFGSGF